MFMSAKLLVHVDRFWHNCARHQALNMMQLDPSCYQTLSVCKFASLAGSEECAGFAEQLQSLGVHAIAWSGRQGIQCLHTTDGELQFGSCQIANVDWKELLQDPLGASAWHLQASSALALVHPCPSLAVQLLQVSPTPSKASPSHRTLILMVRLITMSLCTVTDVQMTCCC